MYISCLHFISFHDVIMCLFSNFYCVKMQQRSHTLTLFQIDYLDIFLVRPAALDNGLFYDCRKIQQGESYQQSRVASNLWHHAAGLDNACHATRGKCGLDRDPWVVLCGGYLPTVQTVQCVQCVQYSAGDTVWVAGGDKDRARHLSAVCCLLSVCTLQHYTVWSVLCYVC